MVRSCNCVAEAMVIGQVIMMTMVMGIGYCAALGAFSISCFRNLTAKLARLGCEISWNKLEKGLGDRVVSRYL